MSVNLPAAFIAQFDAEVKHAYQGQSKLMNTVRVRTGVIGSTLRFPKMGKGLAQPHVPQADVTPMNVGHSNATATLQDWDAPEYTDIFQQQKINFDERRELVTVIAGAMGRRADQLILDAAELATENTVDVAIGGNNAFNIGKLRRAKKLLDAKGVPSDRRHFAISATAMEQLLGSTQATSTDYNAVRSLVNGEINSFVGFQFHMIEDRDEGGLPLVGNSRTLYAWHQDAIGLAIGLNMRTEINYIPEKTSWLINGVMSAGAVNIDNDGIVDITIDESVAVNA